VNWKLLLDDYPDVSAALKRRYRYILVDEYQDTNKLQAEVVDAMAEVRRNVMVVGDDAQSIYSFRGASFENIITFPLRFPEARIYKLEINYRSTRQILSLANASIAQNRFQFRKELQAVRAMVPTRRSSESTTFSSRHPSSPNVSSSLAMKAIPRRHRRALSLALPVAGAADGVVASADSIRDSIGHPLFEQAHIQGRDPRI